MCDAVDMFCVVYSSTRTIFGQVDKNWISKWPEKKLFATLFFLENLFLPASDFGQEWLLVCKLKLFRNFVQTFLHCKDWSNCCFQKYRTKKTFDTNGPYKLLIRNIETKPWSHTRLIYAKNSYSSVNLVFTNVKWVKDRPYVHTQSLQKCLVGKSCSPHSFWSAVTPVINSSA
jgi:hypothetical protein